MTNLLESPTLRRTTGLAAGIAVLGMAVAACGSSDEAADADATTTSASGTTGAADSGDAEYRNGEYSATGSYQSPGGKQSIGVTVVLNDDVVTMLSLDRSMTKGTSAEFQEKFASGIDDEVVGKNIDDLDVSKVSGSSLTSGGFNDAIDQIKSQART